MRRPPKQPSSYDGPKLTGRGGWRPGSGRPRGPRAWTLHRARGSVPGHCPVHVTLRVRPDVPSLRGGAFVREFRRSLAEAKERGDFRVAHYALQHDRLHLIVEAQGMQALANGMKSIASRLARAMNRSSGRSGPVLDGRYHHHLLRTPQEVRQALAYVLLAARREASRAHPLDPASSGRWFDGWRPEVVSRFPATRGDPEVARARTWLLKTGWRRQGLVNPTEVPQLDKGSLPPT